MPNIIHETILKDITDLIGDTKDLLGDGKKFLGNGTNVLNPLQEMLII